MRHFLFFAKAILLASVGFTSMGQKIEVRNMTANTLKNFNTAGTLVLKSVQFTDKNGLNYIIATLDENTKDDYSSRTLMIEHFVDSPTKKPRILRQITDFEKDCPVDNQLDLIKDSFTVSDLNKNGYAEIIFLYKTGCKGDVSPSGLKLMVLENGGKAAIRGQTIIKEFNTPREMNPDASFKKLPESIQNKARALWHRFEYEY